MLLFNKVSLAGNPKSPVARLNLACQSKGQEQIITIKAKYQGYQGKESWAEKEVAQKKTGGYEEAKKAPKRKESILKVMENSVSFGSLKRPQALAAKALEEDENSAMRGALEGVLRI